MISTPSDLAEEFSDQAVPVALASELHAVLDRIYTGYDNEPTMILAIGRGQLPDLMSESLVIADGHGLEGDEQGWATVVRDAAANFRRLAEVMDQLADGRDPQSLVAEYGLVEDEYDG